MYPFIFIMKFWWSVLLMALKVKNASVLERLYNPHNFHVLSAV